MALPVTRRERAMLLSRSSPRRTDRHRSLALSLGVITLLVVTLIALVGPMLAPYSPLQQAGPAFSPPGGQFLLGTDDVVEHDKFLGRITPR